jgi:signal transduction histidine kinase/CheY-like chemotaxis protein
MDIETNRQMNEELRQTGLRVVILLVVVCLCILSQLFNFPKETNTSFVYIVVSIYEALAIIAYREARKRIAVNDPGKFAVYRRLLMVLLDITITILCMYNTLEFGSLFFPLLLWVILGSGFRFGKKSLLTTSIYSTFLFGLMCFNNPYWSLHPVLCVGLLLSLLLVPPFALDIIDRISALNEELAGQLKLAKAAEETKARFLANMSHEIRTPLNGVIGLSELMKTTEMNPEQNEFVKLIHQSAQSLLEIINDILDFSKLESGMMMLDETAFDPRELIEECCELINYSASENNVELAYLAKENVPQQVRADRGKMRQVLLNFLSNAVKFTKDGEVTVICYHQNFAEQDLLQFDVRDTGIGIIDEGQKKLFAAFVQADLSTTRKYGGTGLGLAISKQLVELMNGKIGLESEPGIGSVFSFNAPVVVISNPELPELSNNTGTCLNTAVIVESNLTNQQWIKQNLSKFGIVSIFVQTQSELLETIQGNIQENGNNLISIISDNHKEIDPKETVALITANPAMKNTKLILLAAKGFRGDTAKYEKYGFDAYLTKPLKQNIFNGAIRKMCTLKLISPGESKTIFSKAEFTKSGKRIDQILLVEDNLINQTVATGILEKLGYEATIAANGAEAIRLLELNDYALILMDMQMPVMDGLEATKRIRTSGKPWSSLPIIALTANVLAEEKTLCLNAGMNDYLSKPMDIELLASMIEKHLASSDYQRGKQSNKASASISRIRFAYDELLENLMGDAELAKNMLGAFLVDSTRKIVEIENAAEKHELEVIQELSTEIMETAASLSANFVNNIASQIASSVSSNDIVDTIVLIQSLKNEMELLEVDIRLATSRKQSNTS